MIQGQYDIICLVSNDLNTDRRMIRTCNFLVAQGKSVLLVGRELSSSHPLTEQSFDQYRVKCSYNSGVRFYIELPIRLRAVLKKLQFEKLLCADLDTALCAKMINKQDRKFYLDLHEYFTEVPELSGKYFKKWIWNLVERITVNHFDVIYTVNQSLADIFSKKLNREISVIRNVPNLIDQVERSTHLPIESVYLGVLNPGRGLKELIGVIKDRQDIHLTIIGDGPLRTDLEKLAEGASNIVFLGSKPPNMISSILNSMDIGWNLLNNSSKSYYYSLANKFFDYTHHGLPVITMDFPEYKKLVDQYECGWLLADLSESNINAVIDEMVHLFQGKGWTTLRNNCHQLAKEKNWEKESAKLRILLLDS